MSNHMRWSATRSETAPFDFMGWPARRFGLCAGSRHSRDEVRLRRGSVPMDSTRANGAPSWGVVPRRALYDGADSAVLAGQQLGRSRSRKSRP
jgi:hypothetical protein